MSGTHEELVRLAEAVPEDQVPAAAAFLRQLARPAAGRREFGCAGTLTAEPDFGERSEDILRDEIGRRGTTA
ncbi:hypothetical protein OG874_31075 [Nocardia sp. NBC_00565]|uniref:hypothetical protein n=1 Tax=Nocardia sp. NBC_00565 TaxID=2975993 RepID=UPI002E8039D1|nr:hypothetical protein [Nocardia sp. NBC_00565]WUC01226.1 hypothetical protein OG874_31075 [Nocardia sp. NBC_00565]